MSYQDIKKAIETRQALIVVGADATIQSVSSDIRPRVSWRGLIESGIGYVEEHIDSGNTAWANWVNGDLSQSDDSGRALIMAAQKVRDKLGESHFRAWLRKSLGDLTISDERLLRAICSLHTPIATTNYDTLIESHSGVRSATWKDPVSLQQALSLRAEAVMHLHGVWSDPDSVIFSMESYGRIIENTSAQLLQSAALATKTWIFVGAGDTISDPNLGRIIDWVSNVVPGSDNFHYLLCRGSEVEKLQKKYAGTCIVPVKFGAEYSDLIGYLTRLSRECWGGTASDQTCTR